MVSVAPKQPRLDRVPTLLWASWACVTWVLVAQILYALTVRLPGFAEIAVALRGAVALLGAILAALYLIFGERRRIWGVVALLINAGHSWLFVSSFS